MLLKKLTISLMFFLMFGLCLVLAGTFATPNSTLFSIKRLQEFAMLQVKRTPDAKVAYFQTLISRRLSDIEYVTSNKHYRYVLPTNLRFVTTAGNLANYVTTVTPDKKEEVMRFLEQEKKKLSVISKKYINEYPGDDQWRYYQDSQNYLDTYLKQLK